MNNRINNIRLIAAIAVVLIHVNAKFTQSFDLPIFDYNFNYITRFAVPYFLIISGYFWMGKYKKEAIKSLLVLQFVLIALVAIEEAIFGSFLPKYVQDASTDWYLPAVCLMMVVALFFKKKNYIYLFLGMFVIANLRIKYQIEIPATFDDVFSMFIKYGYMFYFGYVLKVLMEKPKFVKFISKCSYLLLGIFIAFQLYNAFSTTHHYSQSYTMQFLFVIPLVLFALSPNEDKALKYNMYSLDLFLYHILFVSVISYINVYYIFLHVTSTSGLVITAIVELVVTVILTIAFGKLIRYIDDKYIKFIY